MTKRNTIIKSERINREVIESESVQSLEVSKGKINEKSNKSVTDRNNSKTYVDKAKELKNIFKTISDEDK